MWRNVFVCLFIFLIWQNGVVSLRIFLIWQNGFVFLFIFLIWQNEHFCIHGLSREKSPQGAVSFTTPICLHNHHNNDGEGDDDNFGKGVNLSHQYEIQNEEWFQHILYQPNTALHIPNTPLYTKFTIQNMYQIHFPKYQIRQCKISPLKY